MAAYVSNTYWRQTSEKGSFNKIETFAASLEKFPPLIKRDNPKPNRPAPKALSMQIEIQLMPLKAFN